MITTTVNETFQEIAWNVDLRRQVLGISDTLSPANPDGVMKALLTQGTIGFHTADVSLSTGKVTLTGKDTLVIEACPMELIVKLLAIGPALEEAFEYRRTQEYIDKVQEIKDAAIKPVVPESEEPTGEVPVDPEA